jgi:cytochrome c oxidase cbb3-type subunit 3
MPAFGESAGGFLTPPQVDVLVAGMRTRWNQKDRSAAADMPPYFSEAKGNPEPGLDIFRASCASCHQQGQRQITDANYLSLVSDQSLRTIVIAGRPDLGHPDWKQVRRGRALTDQDISDVVAYLHSLQSDNSGQPYPATSNKR